MTLKEVGRGAGFSERVVQGYETGENKIRLWQLERIAKALGVPAYSLLNDYDAGRVEDERAMLSIMRRLSPNNRQRAIMLLAALEQSDQALGRSVG